MANQCKFYKVVRQVSYDSGVTWVNIGETQKGDLYEYDSAECGAVTQYRWVDVTGAYTCEGTTKYQKTKKQYSTDGTTWQDVSPAEYGRGDMIEIESVDCGYDTAYSGQYLTFIARENTSFSFVSWIRRPDENKNRKINSVYYSLDGGNTWTEISNDQNNLFSQKWTPTVSRGNKILWKGNFVPDFTATTGGTGYNYYSSRNGFESTGAFDVVGNVMSLYHSDNFRGKTSLAGTIDVFNGLFHTCNKLVNAVNMVLPATTLGAGCYKGMFWGCSNLVTFPELPSTSLQKQCYMDMFRECSSLTTVPALRATTVAEYCYQAMFEKCTSLTSVPSSMLPATNFQGNRCYQYMFNGCTSLTTAPALPATSLTEGCYMAMFSGCTSLTTAPVLSAETLEDVCYAYMFKGCSNLSYIKCIATSLGDTSSRRDWVVGVSSSGTFVKASDASWTTGVNGIPTNWTVQNA